MLPPLSSIYQHLTSVLNPQTLEFDLPTLNKCPKPSDFDSLDPLFLPVHAWLSIVCSSNTSLDCSVALYHSLLKGSKTLTPSSLLSCHWCYNFRLDLGLNIKIQLNKTLLLMRYGVKWQDTTRSWSGEPELMEGTWLQLMCCAPSRSRCPKFRSNGVHEFHEGIPEYSGEDGD